MVECPNCNTEVHDRGLVLHLSRYCKARDVATASALVERRQRGEAIAEAARLHHIADEQEEELRQQQQQHNQAHDVSIKVSPFVRAYCMMLTQILLLGAAIRC